MMAALLIPVLFLLLLVLTEPAILLYNRVVMANAAAEGCRLLATRDSFLTEGGCIEYIERRLGAIPAVKVFHVGSGSGGSGSSSWDVRCEGSEDSSTVQVTIVNHLEPLPLLGWGTALAGLQGADGLLQQTVTAQAQSRPAWVSGSPREWVSQWE